MIGSIILAAVLICAATAGPASTTRQVHEKVIWNGDEYYAEEHPGVLGVFEKGEGPSFVMISTANYRGYRATWEIKDGRLYLRDMVGRTREGDVTIADVFPKRRPPIPVDWYTGAIIIPGRFEIGRGSP